jgi:hypothetical protein
MATERHPDLPPFPDDYEPPRQVAYEEYLRLEEELPGRYEYHAGMMYPCPGALAPDGSRYRG